MAKIMTPHQITTHTPQGDGNSQNVFGFFPGVRLQPTPRKGTETLIGVIPFNFFVITTHTPQGDGNRFVISKVRAVADYNPHPARGRK